MRSFIFGTAFALAVATGAAGTALAGNTAWGDASNGNGYYHESNGASTGWGDADNGNGYYHESNGKAAPHQLDLSKKPAQGPTQPANN
jgi:hypothetical protein